VFQCDYTGVTNVTLHRSLILTFIPCAYKSVVEVCDRQSKGESKNVYKILVRKLGSKRTFRRRGRRCEGYAVA
jgi:hypothetical protein